MHTAPVKISTLNTSKGLTGFYVVPDVPFWFVPGPLTDKVFSLCRNPWDREELASAIQRVFRCSPIEAGVRANSISSSLAFCHPGPYKGRGHKRPELLSELWFHITDSCNLSCTHCLFGNAGAKKRRLDARRIISIVDEAYGLGCRLVCFTGGEPFLYPGFVDLIKRLQRRPDLRTAILTNGILVKDLLEKSGKVDPSRIHLQVSLDGPRTIHEKQRGKDTFHKSVNSISRLLEAGFPVSIAMAVHGENLAFVADIVKIANEIGVANIHYQYHFQRGLGRGIALPGMKDLGRALRTAYHLARKYHISIDNVEAMASQLFTPPGTRFDLGNGGWESLAIGPDGNVYPTPAMVDKKSLCAGNIDAGIAQVWQESSLLQAVRSLSLFDCKEMADDPLHFLTGGGDIDHALRPSASDKGLRLESDPYSGVYQDILLMLVEEQVSNLEPCADDGMIVRMGDITSQCPSSSDVNFIHCNCLLSLAGQEKHMLVRAFYEERAKSPDELILNPVKFNKKELSFIPEKALVRMYGCGSPVKDAAIECGEKVLDLGCGTGVECFLAARIAGPGGIVAGLDLTDQMLQIASSASKTVKERLGNKNIFFIKGLLESIPAADNSFDVVISNCVLNLSKNKRAVFKEIWRVLRPGGRLVISDVVTENEPPLNIRTDKRLAGECIGGAFVQEYLFSLLRDMGFVNSAIIKRFPYRSVAGHAFFSLTFQAMKPVGNRGIEEPEALYAGPFAGVVTDDGQFLPKGRCKPLGRKPGLDIKYLKDSGLLLLDGATRAVINQDEAECCSCAVPDCSPPVITPQHSPPRTGCLLCGSPLRYFKKEKEAICAICGRSKIANGMCAEGHFVCDACHVEEPLRFIEAVCVETAEIDMIKLLNTIRKHRKIPMHGPEHHALVPGIILSAYRNSGGSISSDEIVTGIKRGAAVSGGACAFWGACGAGLGAGVAFSVILQANPLTADARQQAQAAVAAILKKISETKAARCCQRESYTVLKETAAISEELLAVKLIADADLVCQQHHVNKECIKFGCRLYPAKGDSPLLKDIKTSKTSRIAR